MDILNQNIVLLANSKEQIFVEKLKSLLIFGTGSTRYKDILDFYYLINETRLDKKKLYLLMNDYIFLNKKLDYQNVSDIIIELDKIFKNNRFLKNFNNIKNNWLELPIDVVSINILEFLKSLNFSNI